MRVYRSLWECRYVWELIIPLFVYMYLCVFTLLKVVYTHTYTHIRERKVSQEIKFPGNLSQGNKCKSPFRNYFLGTRIKSPERNDVNYPEKNKINSFASQIEPPSEYLLNPLQVKSAQFNRLSRLKKRREITFRKTKTQLGRRREKDRN